MSIVGIYKIISPTGKVYIGQSWDIDNRQRQYKNLKCKGQPALYNSILKYGFKNHSFDIVQTLPNDTKQNVLDEYEIFFIEHYKQACCQLLNIKGGGSHGKHSEETKKKVSEKSKGNKRWLGKKHSESSKEKIRVYRIGKKLSEDHIAIIKKVNTGNKYSLGFKHTIETRRKLSLPVLQLSKDGSIIARFYSSQDAADSFSLKSKTSIHNVLSGLRKTAAGFLWEYENK